MITIQTQELPQALHVNKGKVAFIGDQTHCSNIAARIHKNHQHTFMPHALSLTSDLPGNRYPSVDLVYLGHDFKRVTKETLSLYQKVFIVTDDVDVISDISERLDVVVGESIIHVAAIDSDGLTYANKSLHASDWLVLRELERKFLEGTPLNITREFLRKSVSDVIAEHKKEL